MKLKKFLFSIAVITCFYLPLISDELPRLALVIGNAEYKNFTSLNNFFPEIKKSVQLRILSNIPINIAIFINEILGENGVGVINTGKRLDHLFFNVNIIVQCRVHQCAFRHKIQPV